MARLCEKLQRHRDAVMTEENAARPASFRGNDVIWSPNGNRLAVGEAYKVCVHDRVLSASQTAPGINTVFRNRTKKTSRGRDQIRT